jgi:hypothetical protein
MTTTKEIVNEACDVIDAAIRQIHDLNELCDRQQREIERLTRDLDALMRASRKLVES